MFPHLGGDAGVDFSYIPLANKALQHIGESDRIVDPSENTKPARAIKRAWDLTRIFLLGKANWSFAVRTVTVTMREPDVDWPIALGRNAFVMPADIVRFIEIVQPGYLDDELDRYQFEGGPNGQELLTTDPGPITIRYVRDGADIADPANWSTQYAEAFAFRLGWEVSDELAADKGRKDRALAAYKEALIEGRKANNRYKARRRQHSGDWVNARRLGFTSSRAPGVCY